MLRSRRLEPRLSTPSNALIDTTQDLERKIDGLNQQLELK